MSKHTDSTPPGWYPDASVPGGKRYWDGTRWTSQIKRPKPPKMNGLALARAYISSCTIPGLGYIAGVMAVRRRQRLHAASFFVVGTINLLVVASALSAGTY